MRLYLLGRVFFFVAENILKINTIRSRSQCVSAVRALLPFQYARPLTTPKRERINFSLDYT